MRCLKKKRLSVNKKVTIVGSMERFIFLILNNNFDIYICIYL